MVYKDNTFEQLYRFTDILVQEFEDYAVFCDIWILSNVNLMKQMHLIMNNLQTLSKNSLTISSILKDSLTEDIEFHEDKFLKLLINKYQSMKEMSPHMTGYGRKMCYEVHAKIPGTDVFSPYVNSKSNKLIIFKEGEFKNGVLDGFGRTLYQSVAEIGFYLNDFPYGKFQVYIKGELEKQGLFDSHPDKKTDYLVQEKQILSFNEN